MFKMSKISRLMGRSITKLFNKNLSDETLHCVGHSFGKYQEEFLVQSRQLILFTWQVHIAVELLVARYKHFQMENSKLEGNFKARINLSKINCFFFIRITGLDPAGPNFFPPVYEKPLSPSDGRFVDTIQSDNFFIGTSVPLGHVSFFPNNGSVQAGCAPFKLNSVFDFITGKKLFGIFNIKLFYF